jgi:GNAT superfamily N-acetyltransferase
VSRVFQCQCGTQVSGEAIDDLAPLVLEHFDRVHSELELTLPAVVNYLEAEDRMAGRPSEPLDELGEVEIRAVGPSTVEDILDFFDHDAMVGRPEWGACYCMYFALDGGDEPGWENRTWQQNRADQEERIGSGRTTGVVAYVDGKLAGWCNAGARAELPGLATGDDEGVASIVCFAIAPPYRGLGLGAELLDGAVALLRERGFRRIEAYPVMDSSRGDRAFQGPVDLYLGHGFALVSEEPPLAVREI